MNKKIDLSATQQFHRRNLSGLIAATTNNTGNAQNFVVSTKTHERRTLEEIEQSAFAYGDESQEEVTSKEDSSYDTSPG